MRITVSKFLVAILVTTVCSGLIQSAVAVVGRTPGTFAVSPTGAATYTIPIWAPPGPRGLQPNLALTYNSRGGDGFLGVGWALSGLSSIYRCNATFAQNASAAPVTLTGSDVFCMDGQQLRLVSGTYGADGSTYQTEIANFENVTAHGAAGNGPSYFVVKDRNGISYQYGNGGGSRVLATNTSTALTWLLNEVSDPAGNTMTVSYTAATGTAVPSTISWTPSSYGSSSYNYTMTFAYGANVPQSSRYGYVAGTPVVDTNLLNSISINYSGSIVKRYVLTYQQSPTTQRERLVQIQECSDSGTSNCLAPTTIAYQDGAAGISTSSSTVSGIASVNWVLANYDLNADGYKDLLYQNASGTWYVAFGSASGYGSSVSTGVTTAAYTVSKTTLLVGDLLGGGTAGLLANNGGTWSYYTWNGSSFTGISTGVPYDTAAASFALADTNGDGLEDLVSLDLNSSTGQAVVYIRLNTSSGSSVSFGSANTAFTYTDSADSLISGFFYTPDKAGGPVSYIDFNGDGRQDVMLGLNYRDTVDKVNLHFKFPLLGSGNTFTTGQSGSDTFASYYLNWNNDGCTDFISGSVLSIAACNGNPGATIALGYTPIAVMDWDGDGRADLIYASGGFLYVQLSTGQGLGNTIQTSIPYNSANLYIGFDLNGDALDDLVVWNSTSVSYNLHNSVGAPPDLPTSIQDGFGNSVSPSYASLTRSINSTYFELNDAQFPYQNYNGPLYLISQAVFSDPSSASGGTYHRNYYYSGLWLSVQGRGLSPPGNAQTYDSRNGVWDTVLYQRAFPYTGMFSGETITSNNSSSGMLLNHSTSPADTLISNTPNQQIHFPHISNEAVYKYELGSSSTRLVTTTSTSYSYDNYGNTTTVTKSTTDNDTGSAYYGQSWTSTVTNAPNPNPSTGCLSLLTQAQTAYSSTQDMTPVTRTKSFSPDTINCRYTQVVTEPSSSQYKVTESFGFDSFGNINSDTVTGIGMAARQTTANWGTTGQFPMSTTDASGGTTQLNYNFGLGLRSSLTDPNGITTSWIYDSFGRKAQENRADGTYTQWIPADCSTSGNCLIGAHTPIVAFGVYNKDGSVLTDGSTWFDPLERPYLSNKRMLASGAYDRNELRYDSLGRVTQQAFPCAFSAVTTTCPFWTTNSYDVLNRLTQTQRPINSTNATLQTETYQHQGRITIITDANGHAKTLVNDVNGRLRQTKDANNYAVTIGYDAAGSKNSTTDSQGNALFSASYSYGIAPFMTSSTDADLGTWSSTFDALGERVTWQDPKAQHFSAAYDALSRMTDRYEPDLYTHWTWGTSAAAHEIGQLHSVCTGTGTNPTSCSSSGYAESEIYDSVGRLNQRSIQIPGDATYTYTWQYNGNTGLLDTLTYPASTGTYALNLRFAYANGIPQSITDTSDSPNVTLWTANTANARGQLTQETLGNGLVVNHAFDAVTGWLGNVTAGAGGGAAVQNNAYLFDEVGNLTQRQDNNLGLTENVYPDALNRIDHSTLGGTTNLTLTYDPTGNVLSSQSEGGTTSTQNFTTNQPGCSSYANPQPHALRSSTKGTQVTSFCYDANGNVVSISTNGALTASGTWTSYNQPAALTGTSGSSSQFVYDAGHQRYKQMATLPGGITENTIYVGGLLEKVTNPLIGTVYRHYVSVGNNVVVYNRSTSGQNKFYYLTADHLGSTAAITDASAHVVVMENFAAPGWRRGDNWTGKPTSTELITIDGITHRGFTFQERLDNLNLTNFNGRIYGETGQFFSPDPFIPDPTDTQSYNRYSYVRNNPLTRTDPSGFVDDPAYKPYIDGDNQSGQSQDIKWAFATFGQEWHSSAFSDGRGSNNDSSRGSDGGGPGSGSNSVPDGQEQGDQALSEILVTAHHPDSVETQLWPATVYAFNNMLNEAANWRRAILGTRGLATLSHQFFYGVANCVFAGCSAQGWAQSLDKDLEASAVPAAAEADTATSARFIVNGAGDVLDREAPLSVYDTSITHAGSQYLNVKTNVGAAEFQQNLMSNGYNLMKQSQAVTVLSDGTNTWTIYTRTSTGAPGAQFFGGNGSVVKYSLGGP